MQRAHFGDDPSRGQPSDERGALRHDDASAQVLLLKLRRLLEQTLAPEWRLIASLLQLDVLAQFGRHPVAQRAHESKPFRA